MKIIVIVLNWNGKEDTLACLSSLSAVTTRHSVVVVDNGSTDDSAKVIKEAFPDIELIETGKNLGYAEGNNVGLRYALEKSPDAILILNNDTVVDPGILSAFMKRDRPIQGGALHQMSNPAMLDHLGGMWNTNTGKFDSVAFNAPAAQWTEPFDLDYVCGCALFVKAEVFRSIGLFDPRYFLLWEECDWCYRAARKGYKSSFCPEAKLLHRVSASFTGGSPHTTYYWWRNRLLWIENHCSAPERKRLTRMLRPEILQMFRRYLKLTIKHWFVKTSQEIEFQRRSFRATLAGVRDYYLRRFGAGPRWLASKRSKSAPIATDKTDHAPGPKSSLK